MNPETQRNETQNLRVRASPSCALGDLERASPSRALGALEWSLGVESYLTMSDELAGMRIRDLENWGLGIRMLNTL